MIVRVATMLSWTKLLIERRAILSTLIVAQFALSLLALGELQIPYRVEIMIGIGDCQLALAAILVACTTLPWSLRLPVVAVLLFSGWAGHYVCLIDLAYPYVSADEYFIAPLIAGSIFVALWIVRRHQGLSLAHGARSPAMDAGSRKQFTLRDLLLWALAVGLLITIGRQAVRLTDVSGMSDPWESIEFGVLVAPTWFLARLPLLLIVVLLHAVAWSTIAILILRVRWTRWIWVWILAIYSAVTLGELAISGAYLLFDRPFPILPASALLAFFSFQALDDVILEGRFSDVAWERCWGLAIIILTRLVTLTLSLLLLRGAGFRLIPAVQSSSQPVISPN